MRLFGRRRASQSRTEQYVRVSDLTRLLVAIAASDHRAAAGVLDATPSLATARVARRDEFFLADRLAQVYEGDTALHAAAFSYDAEMARELVRRGADVRARNRRGAEPLHAAVIGAPGSPSWNPTRQRAVILYLVEAGADPNASAAGGVTPLHRAVRNRCSAAVEALLGVGADPRLTNDRGSTVSDLVHWTTGRGGTGSAEAKAEQRIIAELLEMDAQ
jgi:ankyrin repeat protein